MQEIDPYSPAAVWGRELKFYRERSERTQGQLAAELFVSESLVCQIEKGRKRPQPDFIASCDKLLDGEGALGRLSDVFKGQRHPTWFRDYVEREKRAASIWIYSPLVIHGLFQIESYASAVYRAGQPWLTDEQIQGFVDARLDRQRLLDRQDAPFLYVVMDQSVLRRSFGGLEAMRQQHEHLKKLAQEPKITIFIVPDATSGHAGMVGAFTIAAFEKEPEIGWMEHIQGSLVEDPRQVALHRAIFEAIRADALPARASLVLIEEELRKWTT